MEKIINIDGKDIRFKSNAATPLRYKSQFGRDYFAEIMKLDGLNKKKTTAKDMESIDMEVFYNIAWVMAKSADNTIPEPISWLDGFETFPLMEVIPELQDMIISTIQTKKK